MWIRFPRATSAATWTTGASARATMYYPIAVPGGLFSIGYSHASQGDSELCGTAIECSLDAFRKMRAFLMKTKGLSENEAISLMSIAVDFGVTPGGRRQLGASTPSSRRACF